jgi:succinate dehydrogenase / fumarate reductase iron-sulfur subunit
MGDIMKKVKVRIQRFNPSKDRYATYDEYDVTAERWTTVLDALLYIKAHIDHSIALRYSCRMASCGSCGMLINGVPRLACYTKVYELNTDVITCKPLPNFPIIRDLATDFKEFFAKHKSMKPYIINEKADGNAREFIQKPEDVEMYLQFSYCIKCGLCYSACPTVGTDKRFPGPQALAQMYRYLIDNRDDATKERLRIVDDRHGVWRCHFAGSCSTVCPKGVDPALGIQLLRAYLLGYGKEKRKKGAMLYSRT